jgi:hypothetical protein
MRLQIPIENCPQEAESIIQRIAKAVEKKELPIGLKSPPINFKLSECRNKPFPKNSIYSFLEKGNNILWIYAIKERPCWRKKKRWR